MAPPAISKLSTTRVKRIFYNVREIDKCIHQAMTVRGVCSAMQLPLRGALWGIMMCISAEISISLQAKQAMAND